MPRFRISSEHRDFAKQQRREPTRAEEAVWQVLRAGRLGFKFKRQVPIGIYTVDFVCLEKRLVVEVDGPLHENDEQRLKDERRDLWLMPQGFEILRLPSGLVIGSVEIAAQRILEALTAPSPDPR
ncbi:endonuclease domain-containing protein [Microvirga flavescens]|uniref:endonuclease domain-containing protein n=1 Tax=Microvirga flavescens TaxID=2249811 RepID=UPI000DDBB736|nr:DUF559 domain-containing protein [Microvirga flavescens]